MKNFIYISLLAYGMMACGGNSTTSTEDEHDHHHNADEVSLKQSQIDLLGLEVGQIPTRNMSSIVETNGQLLVPPQNEADVTAVIGANVQSIKVIEGESVKKGQTLAYISHPDIIQLQTDYVTNWNELQYLKTEYDRQQKLYDEKINSGKEYDKIRSEYLRKEGTVNGLAAQLRLLGISTEKLQKNEIYDQIPVRSPISGFIKMVNIRVGQYVTPEKSMFEIVNIDHIHADLMVFEKDVHKVKEGQKVSFEVSSIPGKELEAVIYAVGKSFEDEPKAVHIHAEIENKEGLLIPGMYVRGRIATNNQQTLAMPEDAVILEDDKNYIFKVSHHQEGGDEWIFKPVEVIVGERTNGWVEVSLIEELPSKTRFAMNNAYTLISEMKKEEAEHDH
ncbi:efflux RND transporter periplasmic adaptor subunit [Paracrocinitomix mangrovi]|uniref:efflux RND transporter periplasmic adaptor subunit n=1 Tax=Paracrocinitomix mangrovi TaxID=2862509 RepID=UPI001C8D561C|nr:efflux RND transporter periplasmic adaptor subunit [Paracrocinitomix mangrovi]UKN01966.1 efflux RND transporter periplasmic adaptor subunit [Paracrocinitomix mangrovi]